MKEQKRTWRLKYRLKLGLDFHLESGLPLVNPPYHSAG
jgi:hypothetical protein